MKLIFALGNPESRYQWTRHNVGFLMAEYIAKEQGINFQPKIKFNADIAEFTSGSEKILIVKPTTYYNEVGVSARALLDFYKLSINDILIIHDDAVLDFGKVRIRQGGRDAGNNGLKSLHQHIGNDFWHIRIGADSLLRRQIGDTDFVLGKFNTDECTILNDWTRPTVLDIVNQFINGQLEPTSYTLQ